MAKEKTTEANIRDHIAAHLDLVEPGLVLVDTEFYLPNKQGASGFLDIFARDAAGKLIIIEIKRTDAAAREAIQELYKYVPLLREKFLIKHTDVRLILLSVEWHELATPVAEFAATSPFEVTVGTIILNADGTPVAIESMTPTTLTGERKIGVRHFLWGFPDKATAAKAVDMIAQRVQRFGLTDFVIIQSRATKPTLGGRSFLYFAQRELRFEEYMTLIEASFSNEELEEFRDSISDLTELEDRVAEASDAVWSLHGGAPSREIGADTAEIAHPEKGGKWFEDGAQEDIVIHRFGRFEDPWLKDQTIIEEIRGEGGESDSRLRSSARTDSPPQMAALRRQVENVFFFNETWLGTVTQLLRYAERKDGPAQIELIAYSPEDILRAIAASALGFPGYVPTFRLDIEHNGGVERFIGLPEWDRSAPDFDKVIAEHFSGNSLGYFIACHFGTNRSMNRDIMTDLGLHYAVFREGESGLERVRVQGSTLIPIKGAIHSINLMVNEHQEEVDKLVEIFMSTDQGFAETIWAFLHIDAERQLAKLLESEAAPAEEMYWCGDITDCDLCGQSFEPMRFMIDAIFQGGFGANVCALCFLQEGRGIGTGLSQVYEASAKGWQHIAG
ncbi:endonuclease NucS domain-containing protein [Hyphomonas sp. UBA1923]|uniref:endonuclease NucS domain-containing protein n=1 Tax=Hyphomonas sp. UBA1923 TaxID=1946617 RepID=UPI0025C49F81|nr:endonuclease NucS domain-containing protein [Hyphomonas sp. UBA1923]|tara:strand:+ start:1924 stop:3771 length:1848 start_codon:yes stop_codon:yes gene_type:complete